MNFFVLASSVADVVSEAASGAAGSQATPGGIFDNPLNMILIYGAIFGGMYLFMFRPNAKKKKQEEELRKNLDVGDEITTIGGVTGRIVSIKEETDTIVIETGTDKVRLRFKKWAVASNDTQREKMAAAKTASPKSSGFLRGVVGKMAEKSEQKQNDK